ncbi:hypothetical protein AVV48_gp09 [Acinetobacter phage phiAC-1]|uniref:hypothetical protein n=1 Tax=Acinetobacter phage phiAC-1 TaxID=1229760 RepID=UPI00028B416B|nr:hypothetical protein AVV48_gp09 [Acinetobacter phage phiAC-1]AFU62258.1 hypothetical protein phiAC-1_0009 [Acinetobacter phage phiAC-1]
MNLLLTQSDYDKAKKELKQLIWKRDNLHGSDSFAQHMKMQCDLLSKILLAYRRQHNIFDVGDRVVKTHPKNTILWPVLGVYKNGGVWLDYKGFCWKPPRVRHATDEEIVAGRRL